jgi:hypothetical protein
VAPANSTKEPLLFEVPLFRSSFHDRTSRRQVSPRETSHALDEFRIAESLVQDVLQPGIAGLVVFEIIEMCVNRQLQIELEVAHKFLAELLNHKEVRGLLSDEHFSVDGTQAAAWASMKSFRAKDGSDEPPLGGRNRRT